MALSGQQQAELQAQLQQATIACSERGLYHSAKWSAELLNSFSAPNISASGDGSDTEIDEERSPVILRLEDPQEASREARELSRYIMAKSFFDCREYDRCAAVFLPNQAISSSHVHHLSTIQKVSALPTHTDSRNETLRKAHSGTFTHANSVDKFRSSLLPKNISQKALFLALYAKYLSGEKRKLEKSETILGPNDGPATANPELSSIVATLDEFFSSKGGLQNMANSQGWLDYLYGLVLTASKSESLAKQWLLRSVNINPFNWSAWLELASMITSAEDLRQISEHLPRNVVTFFFHIYCSQELFQQDPDVYNVLAQIQAIFPRSAFLQQQKALLLYHSRDYEKSMLIFDGLIKTHPHRLDGMDSYSNLLYVIPQRPKLASLAAMTSDIDKFRPETNCVLGNYYSLISEHEKAVLYFRRALTLDRNFQTAWTLMGHEYIELKNTQAAIESYRRAVDVNRKDYRAWYGLGQGYEMLECHSYSLHYYKQAASLCSHDPKMWAAVGNAYSKCSKIANAIQAYKRALVIGSHMEAGSSFSSSGSDPLAHAVGGALDPQLLYEIALLYEKESQWDEAAAYMELTLAQEEGPEEGDEGIGVTQVTSKARLWLAKWRYSCGEWQQAMELANELCQDGVEVEEAKSLVRDVRSRLNLQDVEDDSQLNDE